MFPFRRQRRRISRRAASGRATVAGVLGTALVVMLLSACRGAPPRDLADLVVEDSLYVDPMTHLPYSGPIFRDFSDAPGERQVEAVLLEGEWDGEMKVYHRNGRIRYMGSFVHGERCGPWTENADSVASKSVLEELEDEVETLGMYPPCPES